MNNLRDGQVKAFSVNASFQSVDGVQRSTHRRLPQPVHLSVQLFMPDRSSVLSRWALHDEISVLVAAAPRKILAISANNLQDVFTSYASLPLAPSVRADNKIGYSIFIYDLTDTPTMTSALRCCQFICCYTLFKHMVSPR